MPSTTPDLMTLGRAAGAASLKPRAGRPARRSCAGSALGQASSKERPGLAGSAAEARRDHLGRCTGSVARGRSIALPARGEQRIARRLWQRRRRIASAAGSTAPARCRPSPITQAALVLPRHWWRNRRSGGGASSSCWSVSARRSRPALNRNPPSAGRAGAAPAAAGRACRQRRPVVPPARREPAAAQYSSVHRRPPKDRS